MAQMRYQSSVPTAGATVTPADWCEVLSLNPAGTLATLTVNFPKNPVDGQPFKVSTTQILTALTMAAQSGSNQTIVGTVTTLAALGGYQWVFSSPNNTWIPA